MASVQQSLALQGISAPVKGHGNTVISFTTSIFQSKQELSHLSCARSSHQVLVPVQSITSPPKVSGYALKEVTVCFKQILGDLTETAPIDAKGELHASFGKGYTSTQIPEIFGF